jgi:hypothetical protein
LRSFSFQAFYFGGEYVKDSGDINSLPCGFSIRKGTGFRMNGQEDAKCPRCRVGRLRSWKALNDEEQEVVRKLPASAEYSLGERQATHRWCTNCWHEETQSASCDA